MTLSADIRSCTACPLSEKRINAVPALPGPGYSVGGLAFMAEAPGEAEDESGKPLTAKTNRWGKPNAGIIFDQMLGMAGLNRDELLILNRVRCRPPRNRLQDYPEAIANCEPWNVAEYEAYDPGLVVLMGNTAMRAVFGAQAKITTVRGTFRATGPTFEWGARTWAATFHPAAVLRNPHLMLDVVNDIRAAVDIWKEGRF